MSAQRCFIELKNPTNPTSKTMTFDVYVHAGGTWPTNKFFLNAAKVVIFFDEATIKNSGTITAAYTSGDLEACGVPSIIKTAGKIIMSQRIKPTFEDKQWIHHTNGTKLATITLTNTADWATSSAIALDVTLRESSMVCYYNTEEVVTRTANADGNGIFGLDRVTTDTDNYLLNDTP